MLWWKYPFCKIFALFLASIPFVRAQTALDTVPIPGTGVSFTLAYLPGGEFRMGSAEAGSKVTLSPFWIGTHEVTHDAYRIFQRRDNDSAEGVEDFDVDAVSRPTPPYLDFTSGMGTRGGYPQVNTTQQATIFYCAWLYQKTGVFYRLPTEAEWEYACRAGSDNEWPAGIAATALLDHAWLYENGEERYHRVGRKPPNAWGLYDMLGNVSEYTLDHYTDEYFSEIGATPQDPWIEPTGKYSRTVRGGSYDTDAAECNCLARDKSIPKWQARDPQIPKSIWWNVDSPFVGFRLVRPVQQPTPEEAAEFFVRAIVY